MKLQSLLKPIKENESLFKVPFIIKLQLIILWIFKEYEFIEQKLWEIEIVVKAKSDEDYKPIHTPKHLKNIKRGPLDKLVANVQDFLGKDIFKGFPGTFTITIQHTSSRVRKLYLHYNYIGNLANPMKKSFQVDLVSIFLKDQDYLKDLKKKIVSYLDVIKKDEYLNNSFEKITPPQGGTGEIDPYQKLQDNHLKTYEVQYLSRVPKLMDHPLTFRETLEKHIAEHLNKYTKDYDGRLHIKCIESTYGKQILIKFLSNRDKACNVTKEINMSSIYDEFNEIINEHYLNTIGFSLAKELEAFHSALPPAKNDVTKLARNQYDSNSQREVLENQLQTYLMKEMKYEYKISVTIHNFELKVITVVIDFYGHNNLDCIYHTALHHCSIEETVKYSFWLDRIPYMLEDARKYASMRKGGW